MDGRPVMMMLMLLVAVGLQNVRCDVVLPRDKRSDDTPAMEAVVSGMSQQLTQVGAQLTALQNQHAQLAARFESSQKQVSFVAYNTAEPFSVAAEGTLVYNHADINLGGGYDSVTGVFTCPTTGLYVFFVNCKSVPDVDEDVGVLVEGRRVCGCYSNSRDVPILGSALATVHMTTGQRAWVHLYRDSARNVRNSYWNTFVGFLVKAEL